MLFPPAMAGGACVWCLCRQGSTFRAEARGRFQVSPQSLPLGWHGQLLAQGCLGRGCLHRVDGRVSCPCPPPWLRPSGQGGVQCSSAWVSGCPTLLPTLLSSLPRKLGILTTKQGRLPGPLQWVLRTTGLWKRQGSRVLARANAGSEDGSVASGETLVPRHQSWPGSGWTEREAGWEESVCGQTQARGGRGGHRPSGSWTLLQCRQGGGRSRMGGAMGRSNGQPRDTAWMSPPGCRESGSRGHGCPVSWPGSEEPQGPAAGMMDTTPGALWPCLAQGSAGQRTDTERVGFCQIGRVPGG